MIDVWHASQQITTADILAVTAMSLHFNKWMQLPLEDIDSFIHNHISTNSATQKGDSVLSE